MRQCSEKCPSCFNLWLIKRKLAIVLALIALLAFGPRIAKAERISKVEWIYNLGLCESRWRPSLKHLDSNNYYSYGALQFQMGTWLSYGKFAGANKRNIYSGALQVAVAMKMLDAGENWHWKTCSAKTTEKLGPYPR